MKPRESRVVFLIQKIGQRRCRAVCHIRRNKVQAPGSQKNILSANFRKMPPIPAPDASIFR